MSQSDLSRFRLKKDNLALMIIDVQEKLVATMDPDEWEFTAEKILHLIHTAKEYRLPIFWTEQYPKGLGSTLDLFKKELEGYENLVYQDKIEFSALKNEEFQKKWAEKGKKQVILTGLECHICVTQTALDLLERECLVFVPNDAVISRHAEDFGAGLDFMEKAGATVVSTEMIMFQLMEKAGTPDFKKLSKLIKP
ncbi:MAG: isochorismatase family protein [Planctomycetota bacterium]|nr:MAG: isochorismatase family protein [Planctomycetota bacterium]